MLAYDPLIEDVPDASHLCQFYSADDGAVLAKNVARYIADGIALRSNVIVVATEENEAAFCRELLAIGINAKHQSSVVFLDAHDMLRQFMVAGYPDPAYFEKHIGALVREAFVPDCGLRIYGEMVGVLWADGRHSAAIRLEQLWNKLQRDVPFRLYCGYPIDVFGEDFETGAVEAVVCAHSHLLPSASARKLETAVARAMEDMAGPSVQKLLRRDEVSQNLGGTPLPAGEALILWLRDHAPAEAHAVLSRARDHFRQLV
jgi:hypothetical protein